MFINRAVVTASLVGGVIAILLSVLYGSPFFAFLSAVLFALSLGLWKYGYMLIPIVTGAGKIVEIRDGYEVSPSRDHILKKVPNGYYATKFLEIRYYESSIDKNDGEKHFMFESFEKAISSLRYIVKISLLVSAVDLSAQIEELKTRRGAAEARKARLVGKENSDEVVRLDREIAMYTRQLDRITSGEKPVELVAYASTTAFGLTKDEAIQRVKRQAKEVKTILSSSLATDVVDLADLDMLRCFEWDKFFPTTKEELADEVF
jgi:hypothetical protein